jgi:antibiotic biosynthesis monooxygenase (ABM) superfamily enzyme
MHVKPGMHEAFLAWAKGNASGEHRIPGHVETLIYQMDADPNTLMLVVLFENREAYHANAASAEKQAQFQTMMTFLAAEPEWHDGEAVFYLGGRRWDESGQGSQAAGQPVMSGNPESQFEAQPLYGTVAHFKVKPGMRSLFRSWMNYSSWTLRTVRGAVNSVAIQMDEHSQEIMIAVVFESREAYRANAENPEQHAEFLQMMEFLAGPPDWHDGAIIWRG